MTTPRPRAGGYGWSDRAGRYVDARGRFVPRSQVRDTLDAALDQAGREMRTLTEQLRAGPLTADRVAAWEAAMRERIRDAHLYSAAAAKGGWDRMTPADYGRVGQLLARGPAGGQGQYQYLRAFAAALLDGTQRPDGTLLRRAVMYAQAARATYHLFAGRAYEERGFDEERNVRHAADSCDGCLEANSAGWVPIGSLPPVGSRDCLTSCKCTIAYRNSVTGERTDDAPDGPRHESAGMRAA